MNPKRAKHRHYFRDVSHLNEVDVYRVLQLFGVTDQAIGHAVKKLLCMGLRGVKNEGQDVAEAIDTLQRWVEMRAEDERERDAGRQIVGAAGADCGCHGSCAADGGVRFECPRVLPQVGSNA